MITEVTLGLILTLGSAAGILTCLIALIVTGPVFKKQRQNLLSEIESE